MDACLESSNESAIPLSLCPNLHKSYIVPTIRTGGLAEHADQALLPCGKVESVEAVGQAPLGEEAEQIP